MSELLTKTDQADRQPSVPMTRQAILAAYPMARLGLDCLNEGIRQAVEDDRLRVSDAATSYG